MSEQKHDPKKCDVKDCPKCEEYQIRFGGRAERRFGLGGSNTVIPKKEDPK